MQVRRLFVGIDVSKDTLDVTILDGDENTVRSCRPYENCPGGWTQLVETLDLLAPKDGLVQCAMESTGRYHEGVARHLREQSRVTHVVNPLAVKRFGQAMLKDTKTDKADSRHIALYLMRMKPEPVSQPSPELQALKEVTRRRRRLIEDRSLEKNRLHASLHRHYPGYQKHLSKRITLSLLQVINEIQSPHAIIEYTVEQIARISTGSRHTVGKKFAEAIIGVAQQAPVKTLSKASQLVLRMSAKRILELNTCIQSFDKCIEEIVKDMPTGKLLLTIPGIGAVTAATILAEVGDFQQFPTADKFIGYCGLYPIVWESGQVKRTYRMSRKGNRWLKTALLVVVGPARQYNPTITRFHERLKAKGKSEKAIGGALAAKLARIIWAMITKNQSWSEEIASRGHEKADAMLAPAMD